MTRRRYTVVFEHGDAANQWVAFVKELPECHTFGRGLAQTRARIREALVLWIGDSAGSAQLHEVLPMPVTTSKKIRRLVGLRARLGRLQQEAQASQEAIVAGLQGSWSVRDIAEVLDLSHQRVSQVGSEQRARRRRVVRKRGRRARG